MMFFFLAGMSLEVNSYAICLHEGERGKKTKTENKAERETVIPFASQIGVETHLPLPAALPPSSPPVNGSCS